MTTVGVRHLNRGHILLITAPQLQYAFARPTDIFSSKLCTLFELN